MLAREKWQIKTVQVLELVFNERVAQMAKHGDAMRALPDGTGPEVGWLDGLLEYAGGEDHIPAERIQAILRRDYEAHKGAEHNGAKGQLTRMHLVREELAEAFELDGDDPEFIGEILQVAALCVQWAEYLLEEEAS